MIRNRAQRGNATRLSSPRENGGWPWALDFYLGLRGRPAEYLLLLLNSEHTHKKKGKTSLVDSHELGRRWIEWACTWTRRRITRFTVHPGRLGFPLIVRGGLRVDRAFISTRPYSPNCPESETACTYFVLVLVEAGRPHRNQARRNPTTHMFALPPNTLKQQWWRSKTNAPVCVVWCGFW
jgi:hypothetical protein